MDPIGRKDGPILHQPISGTNKIHPIIQFEDYGSTLSPTEILTLDGRIPLGFDRLATLDRIVIKQEIELLEAALGYETENKYDILTSTGELLFKATEESDDCARNCYGSSRAFQLEVKDILGRPFIRLDRPMACCCPCFCCCPCGLQEMKVYSPPSVLIGSLRQTVSMCPRIKIIDSTGEVTLKIVGPCCTCGGCGSDIEFHVMSTDDVVQVGKISKLWKGFFRENLTDADNFGVSFPVDMNIQTKSLLIGACFLIDYMYFERSANQNRQNRHHRTRHY